MTLQATHRLVRTSDGASMPMNLEGMSAEQRAFMLEQSWQILEKLQRVPETEESLVCYVPSDGWVPARTPAPWLR